MADNSHLAALADSFGIDLQEDDPTSVRGLLRFCRRWPSGEVTASQLHNPCWQMALRLRAAAQAGRADLDQNPDVSDDAAEPMLVTVEGYETIADLLEQLPRLAEQKARARYNEALEVFEEERRAVLSASQEIARKLASDQLCCPRCGEPGLKPHCPVCKLRRLYPDPKPATNEAWQTASLHPAYEEVHRDYLAVLTGESSLETLWDSLSTLASHIREMADLCVGEEPEVRRLQRDLELGCLGAARMAQAETTSSMVDLNRGWEEIFESAVSVAQGVRSWSRTSS